MGLGVMFKPLEPKAGQPIPMGEDQGGDFALPDFIHQRQETLALEVQSAANFLDELILMKEFSSCECPVPVVGDLSLGATARPLHSILKD